MAAGVTAAFLAGKSKAESELIEPDGAVEKRGGGRYA